MQLPRGAPVQRPGAHDQPEHDDGADDAHAHPDRHRVDIRQRGGRLAGGGVGRRGFGFGASSDGSGSISVPTLVPGAVANP